MLGSGAVRSICRLKLHGPQAVTGSTLAARPRARPNDFSNVRRQASGTIGKPRTNVLAGRRSEEPLARAPRAYSAFCARVVGLRSPRATRRAGSQRLTSLSPPHRSLLRSTLSPWIYRERGRGWPRGSIRPSVGAFAGSQPSANARSLLTVRRRVYAEPVWRGRRRRPLLPAHSALSTPSGGALGRFRRRALGSIWRTAIAGAPSSGPRGHGVGAHRWAGLVRSSCVAAALWIARAPS